MPFSPIKPMMRPNHCLIFSSNGNDVVPQVYRWPDDTEDGRWCGLGSMQSLEATGRGLFWLTWVAAG